MPEPMLFDCSLDELQSLLARFGHPPYRAQQIWHAVYRELVSSYDEISTLPAALRRLLSERAPIATLRDVEALASEDGRTEKTLFRLADGESIETVVMTYDSRRTACISSQVGCTMGCPLCATGRSGFARNLTRGEVVAQVVHAARTFSAQGTRLSNVVYMGMGEPFANYDVTLKSIRILNDPHGLGLGARSFTVSTVGIVPGINRFGREGLQANLAISLHAASDALRNRLVPVNRQYPLDVLLAACRRYTERTHRRLTFEIALIAEVNDAASQAHEAAARLSGLLCHVNLIPFNPIPGLSWTSSSGERVRRYAKILEDGGVATTIRLSRGTDIQAGCGQLRARQAG